MRYHEIIEAATLLEGRDAPLYHSTRYDHALFIVNEGTIDARTEHTFNGKKVSGVSLTRSWNMATNWSRVVFELDQAKLTTRYKLIPISLEGQQRPDKPSRVYRHDPTNPFSTRRQDNERNVRQEYEEFCVGAIKPLKAYVVAVHILADAGQDTSMLVELCERAGIPCKVHQDHDPDNTVLLKR